MEKGKRKREKGKTDGPKDGMTEVPKKGRMENGE